jgi:2-methylcitrate dehydratase PrpD
VSTVLQSLAERVTGFDARRLTPKALNVARAGVLDTVGVMLAGVPEPATQILLKTPGVADAPGPALIAGTAKRTSLLDATLVNGTASHALDYDDFSGSMGGHQSVPLVAPLLALGEAKAASGRALLEAYALGVETEIKLARAVNFHHYDKGWHPTATLGMFGTVAACARLVGLDAERTTTALAIAASFASGLKANFGTMTKPLHVGHSARSGLLATLLAEQGFEAAADAFEHAQGFLDVFNGPGTYRIEALLDGWEGPLELEADDLGLKQFPCCGSTHAAIMMTLELRREGARAGDVAHVTVLPHRRRLKHTDNPRPQTPLEAKFSVQYVVARALQDGAVRLKDFEGAAFREPEIAALLDRTEARAHPDMADDAAQQWGAEVVLDMKDGRRLAKRIENMTGRGGPIPMSSDELFEKFEDCAARALPREQVMPLFERLETLDSAANVADLMRLMEVSALHAAPRTPPKVGRVAEMSAIEETAWVP